MSSTFSAAAREYSLCLCISKATLSSYYSYSDGHTSTIIHTCGALVKCFFVLFCIIFGSSQRKFGLLQTLITTTICLFCHLIKVSDNPIISHDYPFFSASLFFLMKSLTFIVGFHAILFIVRMSARVVCLSYAISGYCSIVWHGRSGRISCIDMLVPVPMSTTPLIW